MLQTTTLIVLAFLHGTGKTALERALSARVRAVHLRIDTLEQAVRTANPLHEVGVAGYAAAQALAEDNLRLGLTVVADCVNPVPASRADWAAVAQRTHARHLLVQVVCSNLAEHRRRIETRGADIPGYMLPTWERVLSAQFEPIDAPDLVLDTSTLDPESTAQRVIDALGPG